MLLLIPLLSADKRSGDLDYTGTDDDDDVGETATAGETLALSPPAGVYCCSCSSEWDAGKERRRVSERLGRPRERGAALLSACEGQALLVSHQSREHFHEAFPAQDSLFSPSPDALDLTAAAAAVPLLYNS